MKAEALEMLVWDLEWLDAVPVALLVAPKHKRVPIV